MESKELADNLEAAGIALLSTPIPSSSSDGDEQLLLLLDKLEKYLMLVKQSPPNSVQRALTPAVGALAKQELLNYLNVDVKVGVVSCLCEILRITAPDAPYGDEQMKEIFKLIVATFDNISDISSPSFRRRANILETFAKIRLWVLMMDLELDSFIVEMFAIFLRNLRETHPDVVFMYMGYIMINVLDEVEEISPKLLSPILASVRKGNQSVLPIARKLSERVIENCVSKLVPYMHQAVQYMGFPIDDYGKLVAYICAQSCETLDCSKVHNFQENSAPKHLAKSSSCNQEIDGLSSVNLSPKSRHIGSQELSGQETLGNGEINCEKNLNVQVSAATCLAPDDGKCYGEDLIGSRIKVCSSKEHKSYEGDIISYDPLEKKHKVRYSDGNERMLLLSKEQWEFVCDESAAVKGNLVSCPSLDASCEMHQNTKQKISSYSLTEETMRGGTAITSEKIQTSEVGNTHTSNDIESKDGIVDDARKLKDDTTKKAEGKKEEIISRLIMDLPLKNLIPQKLKKLRTSRRANHQLLLKGGRSTHGT